MYKKAVICCLVITGCLGSPLVLAQAVQSSANKALTVPQGWTEDEAKTAYHLYEGSQLMPLRWFLALELSGSNVKLIDNISSYGLIPADIGSADTSKNPDRLPIGMASVEDIETSHLYGEKKWVGVNCTACHTGMIEIAGKKLLIEGGQSLFNIQTLEYDILKSVDSTILDADKLGRFAKALQASEASVRKNLQIYSEDLKGWVGRNHRFLNQENAEIPYGPGRIDGLGGATNDLLCYMTDRMGSADLNKKYTDPRNCRSSQPPTSLPHLWGMTQEQFVQWFGNVHSSIGRNMGQATATYGKNWVEADASGRPRYRTTANLDGVYGFERLYDKLRSPSWNDLVHAGLAEPLAADRVARGKEIFVKDCESCHSIQPESTFPNIFLNSYWRITVNPVKEVGTEQEYFNANFLRTAIVPDALLQDYKKGGGDNKIGADNTTSAAAYRAFVIGSMITEAFDIHKISLLQKLKMSNCRNNALVQPVEGYKARSLEGVIFTGPYLHNGSVPTLVDLLEPTDKRPKTFTVGCRKYDLSTMGYDCGASADGSFLFDTTQFGNSNQGHEYGVNLTTESKRDLIEFLKSLEQPQSPWLKNPFCN